MQSLKLIIVGMLSLLAVQAFSQGVPKAFEGVNYQGKINYWVISLMLANGYIAASSLKLDVQDQNKPLVFEPAAGVADEHNHLKFVAAKQGYPGYFVLDNMLDAYEETPAVITGIYFVSGKKTPVKFRLVKTHKR